MAGIMGSNKARPRLSPSDASASCLAAKAGSEQANVEKIAPAISELDVSGFRQDSHVVGFRCRFWRERLIFDVGFLVGLHLLRFLGELILEQLGLSTMVVAKAPAIFRLSVSSLKLCKICC